MICKSERAFTMLEVLVSLSIFSIAAFGMATAFSDNLTMNRTSDQRSGAIQAAQRVLDALRLEDPADMPTSGSESTTITIGPKDYLVTTTYCSPNTHCTSANIRAISIEVELHGETLYAVDTVYSQLR